MKFRDLKFGEHFLLNEKEYICSNGEDTSPDFRAIDKDMMQAVNVDYDQEVTKLNSYKVAGQYTCVFEVEVYAEYLEQAIHIIENDDGEYVEIKGDYLDGSFSVNREVTESLNDLDYQKNCSDKSYFLEPDFE